MSEVMPATKAREIARSVQIGTNSMIMMQIAASIKEAAGRGETAVRIENVPFHYRSVVIRALEQLGYKAEHRYVNDPREPMDYLEISW